MSEHQNNQALEVVKKIRQGWLHSCRGKALNMNCPEPAAWHLGVILQSNDPEVSPTKMTTAVQEWIKRTNLATFGEGKSQLFSQQWCLIGSYDPGTKDEQTAPHWKLIMTTGYDVEPKIARDLLAEVRVDQQVGKKVVRGCRRTPQVETLFLQEWRQLFPNGSVVVTAFHHPDDEAAFINDMIKDTTGKRYLKLIDEQMVYDSIQLSGQQWKHKSQLN